MSRKFPLFIELDGAPVTIIGGGRIAARRVRTLQSFGARIKLVSPEISDEINNVTHIAREYRDGDLKGALIAVAATDRREVNRAVGLEAKTLGIPVSVADAADECSFFFPAICEGAGLTAGLVSDFGEHRKTAYAAKIIRAALSDLEMEA